ncbi:hypothetical protein CLCR_09332 [Cladophialophora carrionii]|uniref:Uncharacterized protein n=1 Tax=Cladophialophora carrionii TaxID=86049 RepID=A0A1C1CRK0_9EURO|nr:hypothetical protein CLCR_09332 [Cladophialophora carrionii]
MELTAIRMGGAATEHQVKRSALFFHRLTCFVPMARNVTQAYNKVSMLLVHADVMSQQCNSGDGVVAILGAHMLDTGKLFTYWGKTEEAIALPALSTVG